MLFRSHTPGAGHTPGGTPAMGGHTPAMGGHTPAMGGHGGAQAAGGQAAGGQARVAAVAQANDKPGFFRRLYRRFFGGDAPAQNIPARRPGASPQVPVAGHADPVRASHPAQVQAAQVQPAQAPDTRVGSARAAQAQRVYANGSNTEFVHVDLAGDPALRRVLDRAHGAVAAGGSLDRQLALLAAHVKDDIRYDMAAQQGQYAAKGGQVRLGEMIEGGTVVCREKALFTHAALAEMGIASRVVVGSVPDGHGQMAGHAWVELADGTIIDGTWGRIFPAGADPVQGRTRRNSNVFAEPRVELQGGQAVAASRAAAGLLSNPAEMDRMRRTGPASAEEALVRPGVRAWHPDGVTPVTVEYSERHKVQVRHDDGRVEILDRHALVAANGWAVGEIGRAHV